MLQYFAFRLLATLAPLLPTGVGYWLCDRVGDLIYRLMPRRRATVRRNLSIVLRRGLDEVEPLVRETFRQGMKYYYDTFRIPGLTDADLERLIDVEGWPNVERALEEGKGAVIFTGHFGSPALVAQIVAVRGHHITSVVEPVKPVRLFDLINGVRGNGRIDFLPLGPSSFRILAEVLRKNGIVGIVGDRDILGTGVKVKLFGAETTLPGGPVMLCLRTGAALVPAFTFRKASGRFGALVGEPLALERTGDLRESVTVNTQKLADLLEDVVARSPEQWIVFEPLWPDGSTSVSEGR